VSVTKRPCVLVRHWLIGAPDCLLDDRSACVRDDERAYSSLFTFCRLDEDVASAMTLLRRPGTPWDSLVTETVLHSKTAW